MPWIQHQFPQIKDNKEVGFTADEIKRNINLIYVDCECSHCGYTTTLAQLNGDLGIKCPRCNEN
jgi:DNA-directed RNA polymerase subunit RPC12/RpoP